MLGLGFSCGSIDFGDTTISSRLRKEPNHFQFSWFFGSLINFNLRRVVRFMNASICNGSTTTNSSRFVNDCNPSVNLPGRGDLKSGV